MSAVVILLLCCLFVCLFACLWFPDLNFARPKAECKTPQNAVVRLTTHEQQHNQHETQDSLVPSFITRFQPPLKHPLTHSLNRSQHNTMEESIYNLIPREEVVPPKPKR